MNNSEFTIVRFEVPASRYPAMRSDPERRRALRKVEWGVRSSEAGDVLVTPRLHPEAAASLRAVLAGAEGVTEVDVTGDYTFGYTTAPAGYDSFGTLTVRVEAGERLVAILNEHVEWHIGRYTSGLHRFRRAAVAPPPVGPGTVVHIRGRTRRYVVVDVETLSGARHLAMVALSGSTRGSYPTAVPLAEVERDDDQSITFTGASEAILRRKYDEARRTQRAFAASVATP